MEDLKLQLLDLQSLPNNSFICLKVDVAGPMEKYQATQSIYTYLSSNPDYLKILKEKNIIFIVLTNKENISILGEEEMNKIGWYKKI